MDKDKKRVIVVEDNKINLRLFVDLLELNGISAKPIIDGRLAFNEILEAMPELVIMDIQLRDISGKDIIKQIRSTPQIAHLPIIAVTAFASQQDERGIMALGCNAYIAKPISVENFICVVNKYLSKEE